MWKDKRKESKGKDKRKMKGRIWSEVMRKERVGYER